MMRRNLATLMILGAAHSLNHSFFLVLPPLLSDITAELNASFQSMGVVATVGFFIYGFGALIGGPLSDMIGEVKVTRLSVMLSGASSFIFMFANDLLTFGVAIFIMSLWASFYHPTSNNLIYRAFPVNTAGAMGIHGAAGSIGQMFTPTLAYLIGKTLNWRFAYVSLGIFSVVTGLLMSRIPEPQSKASRSKASFMDLLKLRKIWILILYNIIGGLYFRGVELFFPSFLSLRRGFSGEIAALSNSLVLLFGVVGQLLGGKASDKYGSARMIIVFSLGVVVSLLLLLLLPTSLIGIGIFIVLYGICYFGHQPAMTSLIGLVSPSRLLGAAYGATFFFAFGLGSVSTTLAGYLAENFNLEISFWLMTAFAIVALLISLVIPKMVKK